MNSIFIRKIELFKSASISIEFFDFDTLTHDIQLRNVHAVRTVEGVAQAVHAVLRPQEAGVQQLGGAGRLRAHLVVIVNENEVTVRIKSK